MRKIMFGAIPERKVLRVVFLVISSVSFFVYRFLYNTETPSCIKDQWHVMTASANKELDHNNNDNIIIGIGQLIMDCWLIITFLFWLIKLKNIRFGVACVLFFIIRTIHLEIMKLPFPDHIVWHSPGFYSLTVFYDKTRDFYYSGHTGTLTLIMIQYLTLKAKWAFLGAFLCLIYTISMLTITRVHYSIDIVGGFIFAIVCAKIGSRYAYYFDYLFSYPYVLGMKIKDRCGRSNSTDLLLSRDQILK